MKLKGRPCQPPVPERAVQVSPHPALPGTKSLICFLALYFSFSLVINGSPSPFIRLVLIHYCSNLCLDNETRWPALPTTRPRTGHASSQASGSPGDQKINLFIIPLLYFSYLLVNGYPSPLTKLVLIHNYRYPYMDKKDPLKN